MEEYTYLIQQGNYLKIGYTSNLKHRLKQYNTHNADYKLLGVINGDYEVELQSKFKDLKYRDEWFHYSDSIIEQFNLYKESKKHNDLKNENFRYKKVSVNDLLLAIKICNKLSHLDLYDNKRYFSSSSFRINEELKEHSTILNVSKILKILLNNKLISRVCRGYYLVNDKKLKEAINNFENART